jgi:hypothetical protein
MDPPSHVHKRWFFIEGMLVSHVSMRASIWWERLRHDGGLRQDGGVPNKPERIELSEHELRVIAGYAADCARRVLPLFERVRPEDTRPRDAMDAAYAFAGGCRRTNALRQSAWAAYRAARDASSSPSTPVAAAASAADAARAASHAAAAAFLHPLADAHQLKHVLGAAAHAARAEEPESGPGPDVTGGTLAWARRNVPTAVIAVLGRLPAAPPGGGRVGRVLRDLDSALRS